MHCLFTRSSGEWLPAWVLLIPLVPFMLDHLIMANRHRGAHYLHPRETYSEESHRERPMKRRGLSRKENTQRLMRRIRELYTRLNMDKGGNVGDGNVEWNVETEKEWRTPDGSHLTEHTWRSTPDGSPLVDLYTRVYLQQPTAPFRGLDLCH